MVVKFHLVRLIFSMPAFSTLTLLSHPHPVRTSYIPSPTGIDLLGCPWLRTLLRSLSRTGGSTKPCGCHGRPPNKSKGNSVSTTLWVGPFNWIWIHPIDLETSSHYRTFSRRNDEGSCQMHYCGMVHCWWVLNLPLAGVYVPSPPAFPTNNDVQTVSPFLTEAVWHCG